VSPEQVAQVLYQAGFRGQALVDMLAIGKRESGYNAQAHRTDTPGQQRTGDFGLFQINWENLATLQQAGIVNSMVELLDPVKNAQAAFHLSRGGTNLRPWAAAAGGFSSSGDPFYRTNRQEAATAVQNAQQQGLIGQSYTGGSVPTGPTGTGGQPASDPGTGAAGPMELPSDAKLYNNGFTVVAVFDVGGVSIGYDVNWTNGTVKFDPAAVTNVTSDQWAAMGVVNGGSSEELRPLSTSWGSYREFFDSVLNQVMGPNNPARNDPEVLKIIAEFASRPDMEPIELQNKLQATQWYQTRTQGELQWNSLAEAEKTKQRDEMASRMVATWFQFTGEAIGADDPRIQNHLEGVASGKMGFGAWTESVVKTQAAANAESPWSRQVRDEGESQRQRGVDVENTSQRVKDLARRWGVRLSETEYQRFAQGIVEKTMSEADVLEILKDQAKVLFPWKDRDMETQTAAGPWMSTLERVMEKPSDLMDPQLQQAMSAGMSVWDFEKQLKGSAGWLETKNARSALYETISEAGRRLGFE
jgi:hypothetical protein